MKAADNWRLFQPTALVVDASGEVLESQPRAEKGRFLLEVPRKHASAILLRDHGYRTVLIEAPFEVDEVVMRPGIAMELFSQKSPAFRKAGESATLQFVRVEEDPRFS